MPENNKIMTTSSSLPVPIRGGGAGMSSLSLKSHGSVENKSHTKLAEARLKTQLDDCERRRKNLVVQLQKANRENETLQRKYQQLLTEHEEIKESSKSQNKEFIELKRVSEAVYKEYEKLLRRFDVETGAMHKAMQKASDWYKQNRVLKRQSAILVQKFLQVTPEGITALEEEVSATPSEKDEDELDDLRRSVKDLSSETARLQVELNAVKLEEFEAQEQLLETGARLEFERSARIRAEKRMNELQVCNDSLKKVAALEAEELAGLRQRCNQERDVASHMRRKADKARKERNILAHQSSLLLVDVESDSKIIMLLQEIEILKRQLEEKGSKHGEQITELQAQIEELQSEGRIELLEEKLRLAEAELEITQLRVSTAETNFHNLKAFKDNGVETQSTNFNGKILPPPPPPPPPPPLAFRDLPTLKNPVAEMANMLGIKRTNNEAVEQNQLKKSTSFQESAINDIINQIKGGRFTLKATEQRQKQQDEERPAAVQEMLQILGTMKKGTKRAQFLSTLN